MNRVRLLLRLGAGALTIVAVAIASAALAAPPPPGRFERAFPAPALVNAQQPSPDPALESRLGGEDAVWSLAPPPTARTRHTAIHDPVRNRMVVFGGFSVGRPNHPDNVWTFSLADHRWSELVPLALRPAGTEDHAAVYDPVLDRMVVVGGYRIVSGYHMEVWELTLGAVPVWNRLTPTGPAPIARGGHSIVRDPARNRLVLFGGWRGFNGTWMNDVWQLSLAGATAWTQLAPAGPLPAPRRDHAAAFDPVRNRMILFGGFDGDVRNDVWALSLGGAPAWTQLLPSGPAPDGRLDHTLIYDPPRDRLVIEGGVGGPKTIPLDEVWALTLRGTPAWQALAPSGTIPAARSGHAAIYDPAADRMISFGDFTQHWNEVLALDLSPSPVWSVAAPSSRPPSPRFYHTQTPDPARDRILLFGGFDGSYRNEVSALSTEPPIVWALLSPSGAVPEPRAGHSAVRDDARQRLVVFGGFHDRLLADAHALALSGTPSWTALAPAGPAPAARYGHSAVYDPARDRMLVFGGLSDDAGAHRADLWALGFAGPAWTPITPAGPAPSGRYGHAAIHDPRRDRMLILGGYGNGYQAETWALTFAAGDVWQLLAPTGTPPSGRYGATASYDSLHDRVLLFGGIDAAGIQNDVWALELGGGALHWRELPTFGRAPSPRRNHSASLSPDLGLVVFGGLDLEAKGNDLWMLALDTVTPVTGAPAPAPESASRSLDVSPNPAPGGVTFAFGLPHGGDARLEIHDLAGRRVHAADARGLEPGRHLLRWDGRDAARRVPAGVYFCSVVADGLRLRRRIVMLD